MPTTIVVPCFNEERRLDLDELLRLARAPEVRLLLVDDGSTDGTAEVGRRLAARSERVQLLALGLNHGKAEAVRRGMLEALSAGATQVGFLDADLSTPVDQVLELIEALDAPGIEVVLGSRVARAGADVRRSAWRHLTGRVFATAASLMLEAPFYDTQCGAKVFRDGPALRRALSEPFQSRWSFDVELLGRLLGGREAVPFEAFVEVPLRAWHDREGSKLGAVSKVRAGLDLLRVRRSLSRWRSGP